MKRQRYVRSSFNSADLNKGDRLELTLVRAALYQSSGPGANRQTQKRVTIVGGWRGNDPSALASGSFPVKDDNGRTYRLSFDQSNEPLGLLGAASRYDVKAVKRLPSSRRARYVMRAMEGPPYEERIQQGVKSDIRAGHRQLLNTIEPIARALRELQRNRTLLAAFDSKEQAVLEEARLVLVRKSIPMALVGVVDDEEEKLLFF